MLETPRFVSSWQCLLVFFSPDGLATAVWFSLSSPCLLECRHTIFLDILLVLRFPLVSVRRFGTWSSSAPGTFFITILRHLLGLKYILAHVVIWQSLFNIHLTVMSYMKAFSHFCWIPFVFRPLLFVSVVLIRKSIAARNTITVMVQPVFIPFPFSASLSCSSER